MDHAEKSKSIPPIRSTTEFARYVGLAGTTVSRVVNGQPGLKQKSIDRVMKAMEETGFTANPYALYLKGKKTSTVGFCMESLLTPTAVKKLALLQRHLRDQNYTSLIEVAGPGKSLQVTKHFLAMRVEAIVFIGHFPVDEIEARIAELTRYQTPHVVIDQSGLKGANTVTLDRAQAMHDVTSHLLSLGHRSFGLLAVEGKLRSSIDRMAGIKAALQEKNLDAATSTQSLDHLHVRENDFDYGVALARSF